MVSAAILESVREVIAYLEIQDVSRAAAQPTGLVDMIRQIRPRLRKQWDWKECRGWQTT